MSGVKVGDKIVVIGAEDHDADYKSGDTGVVVKCFGSNGSAAIKFDHFKYSDPRSTHYLYGSEFSVVNESAFPAKFKQEGCADRTALTPDALRQNILAIRQEREQTLSKLEDLDTQEAEAISQLNTLGFSLFEEGAVNSSPSKTVLYAEDIEEDMTDPENWKVGDMVQCVNGKGWERWIDEGEVAEMVKPISPQLHLKTKYGLQDFGSMYYRDFKFHSRPVK